VSARDTLTHIQIMMHIICEVLGSDLDLSCGKWKIVK
jgi:hypothetical protein